MRRRFHRIPGFEALLAVACAAAGTPACTLIGGGIGAAADPGTTESVPAYATAQVELGDAVVVHERSGATAQGTFMGTPNDPQGRPVPGYVAVRHGQIDDIIPVAQIVSIDVHKSGKGWLVGGIVGLAADIAVVAVVASAARSSSGSQSQQSGNGGYAVGSCPFVYGFDGARYRLGAEMFSGALFPSAQREDWAVLDHLAEDHGVLKLEITGNTGETEHVDQITLLAVDHPMGTELVSTRDGRLLALRGLAPPRQASDAAGADVRGLLAEADGVEWVSDPHGRNPDRPEDLRDHVDLEFARAHGARTATLVLSVRNTLFGSLMQRKMLAAEGRSIDVFYQQMDKSPLARRLVHDAMIREGMLLVRLGDGEKWQTVDHVWEVGPAAARVVAVPLDIGDLAGDELRVRLDSTVGLWKIDRAAILFGKPEQIESAELTADRAVDTAGRDHGGELRQIDDHDYVMEADSRADLVFRAPPARAGLARTYVVKGTGWYRVNVAPDRDGGPDVALGFVAEPGFFGRFVLRDLAARGRAQ